MPPPDPYKMLELARDATPEQIRSAYRKLAKQHHPDLNPGNAAAEERFKAVNAANELLSDPDKRARFDRGEIDGDGNPTAPFGFGGGGAGARGAGGGGFRSQGFEFGGDGAEMGDIFEGLFGGRQAGGGGFASGFGGGRRTAGCRLDHGPPRQWSMRRWSGVKPFCTPQSTAWVRLETSILRYRLRT